MVNPFALARATALIYRMHASSIFGSKRVLAAIVLAAIPPLFGALGSELMPESIDGQVMDGAAIFVALGVFLTLAFVVPMLSVSVAVGAVADEVESRTITYPFTRPVPRAALFLGRWLAAFSLILLMTVASLTLLAWVSSWRAPGPSRELILEVLRAAALGSFVYSAGAAVIGTEFKRGLIIALAYAFAFELLVSFVPGSSQSLTVQYHLRAMVMDTAIESLFAPELVRGESTISAAAAQLKLLVIAGVLLVYGSWRVGRKQFVLSA